MNNKNKKAIDPNKLTTILLKGDRSYSDGRHDYWYEKLLEVLDEAGINVDHRFLYEEASRRDKVRSSRIRCKTTPQRRRFSITLSSDSELHFAAVFSSEVVTFPAQAREKDLEWDDESEPRSYCYTAPDRATAAQLLRYVKAVHPGYVNLKVQSVG
jgi:hypothetical protein